MFRNNLWNWATSRRAHVVVVPIWKRPFVQGIFCTLAMFGLIAGFSIVSTSEDIFEVGPSPEDPVFNLPFDPKTTQFQTVSVSSLGQCGPLLSSLGTGSGKTFVFGKLVNGHERIFILGNEDRHATFGLSGLLLVVRGDNCRTSGPLLALRRNVVDNPSLDPGLSASDVSLLMSDMLGRYAAAFGSKAHFLAWLDRLTADANSRYRDTPGARCPLTYTITFTPPMIAAMDAYRNG